MPMARTENVTCNWLCGCDGAHSTVRKQLGFEFAGDFEPNDWMLADMHLDGDISSDEISGYWHRDGVLILFPFAPGRFRVIADLGAAPSPASRPIRHWPMRKRVVDERGPGGLKLHDPVWLAGFRIHERKVNEYSHGNVFLSGDAAHIHSPAGGQGMNTGMQDAFNLAWKIALVHHGKARRELLASYTQERSEVGEMVLRNAGLFTRVATLRNPVLQFMRNHLMALAGKLNAVQERAISSLCRNWTFIIRTARSTATMQATHGATRCMSAIACRMRTWPARTARPIRLLDAIRGTGYTLLCCLPTNDDGHDARHADAARGSGRKTSAGTIKSVFVLPNGSSASQHASPMIAACWSTNSKTGSRTAWTSRNTAIALVRPDGYIAFRGTRRVRGAN